MNTLPPVQQSTAAEQLTELYRASDAAALRAQINLQNLPGGPF